MKITTKYNIDKLTNTDLENHSLIFEELTSSELDQIRTLMRSVLTYGQFNDSTRDYILERLSLSEMMKSILH